MRPYIKYFFFFLSTLMFVLTSFAQSVGGTTLSQVTFHCDVVNNGGIKLTGHVGDVIKWQSSTDGGITWVDRPRTGPVYSYFNQPQTTCYRAIVRNGAFPEVISSMTCIDIFPSAEAGVLSGGGTFCGSKVSGKLTLTGNNVNVFDWESSIDGGITWNRMGNTTASQDISGVVQTTLYRVIVQGGTCPKDTSNIDTVTVTPETVPGSITGPGSVCHGSNVGDLTLRGHVGRVIDWVFSSDAGLTWTSTSNITNSFPYSNLRQETWYRAIVQNKNCFIDTTTIEVIKVDDSTVSGALSGGGTFCGTIASGTLTLNGQLGKILSWTISTDGGMTWSSIVNTTDTLNYTNLQQTTLYQTLVQNGGCSALNSTIDTVFVSPKTVAGTLLKDTIVCSSTKTVDLPLTGNVGDVINWLFSVNEGVTWNSMLQTGNTLSLNNVIQSAQYKAFVRSGNCAVETTNTVKVNLFPINPVNAGKDTIIGAGESVVLNGSGFGNASWSPEISLSNPSAFNPLATPSNTTNYILTVLDTNGCINSDSVVVLVNDTVLGTGIITITSLFTPNGDGINDFWFIENINNYPDSEVFIYNHSGHLVYSQENYLNNWEGTYHGEPLPDGTYIYIVKINNPSRIFKGSIDILR